MRRLVLILLLSWSAQMALAQDIPQAPVGGRAVVFDIDGTLTPNVLAIWAARPGAARAVQDFADAGVRVIYLSARRPAFQGGLPDWLSGHGFPAGPLHLVPDMAAHRDPVPFKYDVIETYKAKGWQIIAGFGDSSSDFAAYAAAGLPQSHVFALRRAGRSDCQPGPVQGCYDSWTMLSQITEPLLVP